VGGYGNLRYDPEAAKRLWAQADAIAPWSGSFEIAYNGDGGHKEWVDATTNNIRNTLGIDAKGKEYRSARLPLTRSAGRGRRTPGPVGRGGHAAIILALALRSVARRTGVADLVKHRAAPRPRICTDEWGAGSPRPARFGQQHPMPVPQFDG
jgi:hypothetical protein